MTYILLFSIGGIGFLAMFLLGFAHFGGHGHAGAYGGHGAGHHVGGGHGHSGGHHVPSGKVQFSPKAFKVSAKSWLAISPLDIFAMCLGAGAAGLLLKTVVSPGLLPAAAVVGALAFWLLVTKPITAFASRFVSTESEGLEGMIAKTARAVTGFDAQGRGLVTLTLDGQNVQLLATLDAGDRENGTSVRKGDELVVVDVDARCNTCRVTRELSLERLL